MDQRQNIVYMGGFLAFDFDNGQLEPKALARLLPGKKRWISNSFRHTNEAPRFHAFFPLTRCVTKEEYEFLVDQIILEIEDAGYSVGKDRKGFNPLNPDVSSPLRAIGIGRASIWFQRVISHISTGPRLLRLQWRRNWRRLAHDPAKFECQNSGEKEHGQKHGGELPK